MPLFILTIGLFFYFQESPARRRVPRLWSSLTVVYLVWIWMGPLTGGALDQFLLAYARVILYVSFGILIYQCSEPPLIESFQFLTIALGVVESIFILIAKARGLDAQQGGVLGNPLHSGILLPLAVAFLLIQLDSQRRSNRTWLLGLAFLVLLSGLFFLHSRTGLLLVAILSAYLFPRKMAWVFAAALVFLTVWRLARGLDFLTDLKLDPNNFKSTVGRLSIWASALEAIGARPIRGFGLGNFETAYLMYQRPSPELLRFGKSTIFAHNAFLQQLVETGTVGFLLMMGILALPLQEIGKIFWREKILVSVILVFSITSLINYSMFLPFSGLLLVFSLGSFAAQFDRGERGDSHGLGRVANISLVTLSTAIIISLASYSFSEACMARGKFLAAAKACPIRSDAWYAAAMEKLGKNENGWPELKNALRWNSQNSFYWERQALVLMRYAPTDHDEIEESFRRAQALAPHHAPFYIQEGFYRLQSRQFDQARNLFSKAAELEPVVPLPHFGLGLTWAAQKNKAAARAEFEVARERLEEKYKLENDPRYHVSFREQFGTEYAQFLFNVDEKKLEALIAS